MVDQTGCLTCAGAVIEAAKESSAALAAKVGIAKSVIPSPRSWFCPEHGGYSIVVILRRDR